MNLGRNGLADGFEGRDRATAASVRLVAATAIVASLGWTVGAHAKTYTDPASYCAFVRTIDKPDGRYVGVAVPDWIAKALMRATGAPTSSDVSFFRRAAWRCDRGRVLACSYGANIPCDDKADVGRVPGQGEREYCRENPGADVVPAVATGHAAVYAWRCNGMRPVIVRQVLKVDRRGFPAEFWYPVAPAPAR